MHNGHPCQQECSANSCFFQHLPGKLFGLLLNQNKSYEINTVRCQDNAPLPETAWQIWLLPRGGPKAQASVLCFFAGGGTRIVSKFRRWLRPNTFICHGIGLCTGCLTAAPVGFTCPFHAALLPLQVYIAALWSMEFLNSAISPTCQVRVLKF